MATRRRGREFLNSEHVFDPRHFTHSVTVSSGKMVFMAGQVSYDRAGRVVGAGDLRAQCERVMECIGHNLSVAGATYFDIIKLNAYMVGADAEAIRIFREVRSRHLNPAQLPASTLVGVQSLAHPDLLIEVEVVACVQEPVAARKTKSLVRSARAGAHAAHPAKKRVRR
jgi:enamine deaminase RidA (YjgF/YER057c/UK114 family)